MSSFVKVAALNEIPRLGSLVVRKGAVRIALFRTEDDQVFAMEDKCPHKGGPLSQGIIHGCKVTCPLHNMVINLETGVAVAPDEGKVRTLAVRVEGGAVLLDVSGLSAAA
jgi:nitrite reductase (NADH) small subunit